MPAALLWAVLGWSALLGRAAERPGSHAAPAPSLASERASPDERRSILGEMWQRRILAPDANDWSPEDLRLLTRIREVEPEALRYLRSKERSRAGLIVEQKAPGKRETRSRLTKEGYNRYLFRLSQDAVEFFGRKGVDAKFVFKLKDLEGRPLFAEGGILTEIGELIYTRGKLGMAVSWTTPSGTVMGTRRRPLESDAPPPGFEPGFSPEE